MSEDNTNGNSPGNKLTTRRGALAAFGTGAAALIGTSGSASAANAEVTIAVDPSEPVPGKETSFTCTRAFAEYEWVIVGPSGFEQYTERRVSTTFEEAGEYTAYLTVNQPNGESTYVSKSGQIKDQEPSNPVPTAKIDFSPQNPVYNPIRFDGSGSATPSGKIESYDWYYRNVSRNSGEDVFDNSPNNSGKSIEESFSKGDTFEVGLEVTNSAGNTDRKTVQFTPQENPNVPSAKVLINGKENAGIPSNPVEFDGSESTSPNGDIVEYNWKITNLKTDETYTESGKVVTKELESEVEHDVELTIVDEAGKEDTESPLTFWPDADSLPF